MRVDRMYYTAKTLLVKCIETSIIFRERFTHFSNCLVTVVTVRSKACRVLLIISYGCTLTDSHTLHSTFLYHIASTQTYSRSKNTHVSPLLM